MARAMAGSVNVGNAGEHLIMAELLARGCHAFMADRGNPAFDAAAILPDRRQVKIRVKTCGTNRTIQYNAKATGNVFLDFDQEDATDFVAVVAPAKGQDFEARLTEIWIIPTRVVNNDLWAMNDTYFSTPKKDGSPRKKQPKPWFTLRLDGDPGKSPLNGWSQKWAQWSENWAFKV